MRRSRNARGGHLAAICCLLTACGGAAAAPDAGPRTDQASTSPCDEVPDGGTATLSVAQEVFTSSCAIAFCHGSPTAANVTLDLRPGHTRTSVVNVPADETCGGIRVVPGDPAGSYLFRKLTEGSPCQGAQMPRCEIGSCPLPACQIDLIRGWIAAGAPAN